MSTLSIWPQRLLDVITALAENSPSQIHDPMLSSAASYIPWQATCKGKFIESIDNVQKANGNPWVLCLALYAAVGTCGPNNTYSPRTLETLRTYIEPVRNAGWSNIDILQVVELSKECMACYPTDAQWSVILECLVSEVQATRAQVKPTLMECFTPIEQSLWNFGSDVGISFLSWVHIVKNHDDLIDPFEFNNGNLLEQSN